MLSTFYSAMSFTHHQLFPTGWTVYYGQSIPRREHESRHVFKQMQNRFAVIYETLNTKKMMPNMDQNILFGQYK